MFCDTASLVDQRGAAEPEIGEVVSQGGGNPKFILTHSGWVREIIIDGHHLVHVESRDRFFVASGEDRVPDVEKGRGCSVVNGNRNRGLALAGLSTVWKPRPPWPVVSIHLRHWTSAPREVPHGVAFCAPDGVTRVATAVSPETPKAQLGIISGGGAKNAPDATVPQVA
eukprot:gene1130-biopygen19757